MLMKLFLVLALLATGYTYALLHSTELVLGSVQQMYAQSQTTARAAEQWQQGNTSVSLR
jgi:hypothetical protein